MFITVSYSHPYSLGHEFRITLYLQLDYSKISMTIMTPASSLALFKILLINQILLYTSENSAINLCCIFSLGLVKNFIQNHVLITKRVSVSQVFDYICNWQTCTESTCSNGTDEFLNFTENKNE